MIPGSGHAGRAVHGALVLSLCAAAACETEARPQPVQYANLPPSTAAPVDLDRAPQQEQSQAVQVGVTDNEYADTDPAALSDFREELAPHGAWVDDPTYGTVWVPYQAEVGTDFVPYESAGHWDYENDDYVWVSDLPWGWIPFHYGRWVAVERRGWCWIPGRTYAGAWVVWRTSPDGYLGWAPMPPAWGWRRGVAFGLASRPAPQHFVFRPKDEMFAPIDRSRVVEGPRAEARAREAVPFEHPARVVPPTHPIAQPAMRGPSPHALGIPPPAAPRPTPVNPGVQRAREYGQPRTAIPSGAHPPAPHVVLPAPRVVAPAQHVAAPGPAPHVAPPSAPARQAPANRTAPARRP